MADTQHNRTDKISTRLIAALKPQPQMYAIRDTELTGFVLRVYPSGHMSYVCDYRLANGKRTTTAVGSTRVFTVAQARDQAKKILAEVVRGEDPAIRKRQARQHTLQSFIDDEYKPWAEANRKNAVEMIRRIKNQFSNLKTKRLGELNPWLIEKWRAERLKSDVSKKTVNRDLAYLSAAMSRAVEWKFIEEHPMRGVKRCRVDEMSGVVRYLSDDEEKCLYVALEKREQLFKAERRKLNELRATRNLPALPSLDALSFVDHLKPMVVLSLHTGLRRGEVFKIEWRDIDLDSQMPTIHVRAEIRKSGKGLSIPINELVVATLRAWKIQTTHQSDGLVFPSHSGKSFNNVNHSWKGLLKLANITNFRWHDQRHHFASKLVMAGVDLYTVQELLGHEDAKMTRRYTHLSPNVKAAAVARLARM